ncbi:hypothetical protein PsorP6_017333 [Peronosclerospora sorghi]|uniref:Uncharacterized protein n=1 Tax=Peronosclerospora sorghi TaxID=230839 RepID=A0ACC0WM59_9STRA|nr:hypothetical protein PsorP6_017333 [Peronosclerospora sorghi]
MMKRSLNTYRNALTAADHTMYPFSTTNTKDWHNLMSVYLDAVFFPNLHKLDFLQEGHRLEINTTQHSALVSKAFEGGQAAVPDIRKAVHDALEKVVKDGFNKERVDGILHQLE